MHTKNVYMYIETCSIQVVNSNNLLNMYCWYSQLYLNKSSTSVHIPRNCTSKNIKILRKNSHVNVHRHKMYMFYACIYTLYNVLLFNEFILK